MCGGYLQVNAGIPPHMRTRYEECQHHLSTRETAGARGGGSGDCRCGWRHLEVVDHQNCQASSTRSLVRRFLSEILPRPALRRQIIRQRGHSHVLRTLGRSQTGRACVCVCVFACVCAYRSISCGACGMRGVCMREPDQRPEDATPLLLTTALSN